MADLFKIVLIETNNQCNRKCWFCKFGQIRQDPQKSRMPLSTVRRIIDNLRDLDYRGRISWFWINEPLIDKRIIEILALTRRNLPKAFLALVTNGDVLTKNVYAKLIDSGLDALGVSIYDEKTFQKIMKMKNDHRLVMMDRREGRFVNQGGNIKQNPGHFESRKKRYANASCARPFEMMVINAKGKVALCCADLYTDVEMGDVTENRLEVIWQHEKFRHYRDILSRSGRKGLALCEHCSHDGTSSNIYYPLIEKPHQISFDEAAEQYLNSGI